MTSINYIGQLLIGRKNNSREANLITIDGINANFQNLLRKIKGDNGYKENEVLREETLVLIKLAYMRIMTTISEIYQSKVPGTYEEFDKNELKERVEEAQEKLKQELITEEEANAENRRKNNEYKTLIISQRSPMSEVTRKYVEYLKFSNSTLDEQIRRGTYDIEKVRSQEKIAREKARAYELLSDPEYKMRLDDLLFFNFSPNQEELYIPKNIGEVTYMPQRPKREINPITGEEYQTLNSFKFGDIQSGDEYETVVIHIGNIGYGRFRQKNTGEMTFTDPEVARQYIILKRYADPKLAEKRKARALQSDSISRWDNQTDSEIFVVSGKINERLLRQEERDEEFIRYTQDVLLSTTNLEVAILNNGGYFGEVGLDSNRNDYIVKYNQEALCASIELQKAARISGRTGELETVPMRYKIDKGEIELYSRNPETGILEKEVISDNEINMGDSSTKGLPNNSEER